MTTTSTTTLSKYQIRWAIITISQKKVYKYQVEALRKIGFSVCSNYPASGWYACKHYRNSENLHKDIDSIRKAAVICKSNVGAIDYTDAQHGLCNNSVRPMDNATTLQIEKFSNIIK